MNKHHLWPSLFCILLVAGCSSQEPEAPGRPNPSSGPPRIEQVVTGTQTPTTPPPPVKINFRHENTPENLKSLFVHLRSVQLTNPEEAAALTISLLPTEQSLGAALRPEVPQQTRSKIVQGLAGVTPPDTARRARLLTGRPAQTDIQVHGATTEEVAANRRGSVAFAEFPGGAISAAQSILKPTVRWHEVELLEPGNTAGMKFHLFFWDGTQWRMLGPVWRFLR